MRFKRIEDYGVIGNLESCALVGSDGSIDWCCFPSIDSPSQFAAILDPEKGGHFNITPSGPFDSHQAYIGNTNILTTTFDAQEGSAILTDFMPVFGRLGPDGHRAIFRKLVCTRGGLRVEVEFDPRFNYGRTSGERVVDGKCITAKWQDQLIFLQSPVAIHSEGAAPPFSMDLHEGDTFWFILRYGSSETLDWSLCNQILDETCRFWVDWFNSSTLSRPVFQGPWKDLVTRSALVLKLLTSEKTGAVIAAPTTSIPESIGGIRNWDYRYAWIRDASFTIQAFEHLGYRREAIRYFEWLHNVNLAKSTGKGPVDLRIAYTLEGGDIPTEQELPHLSGYLNSRPVRVGNAAFSQDQLDIYGEVIGTLFLAREYSDCLTEKYWKFIVGLADDASKRWKTKDSGIWEFRSEQRHFTYSKLMCWVALDRAIKLAREYNLSAPLKRWTSSRDQVRKAILEDGFSRKRNSFVQAFGHDALDASSLLIPVMGFLPASDPRVLGTVETISKELRDGNLLCRYNSNDGLPGQEGVFLICSFWLVQALALSGQTDAAQDELLSVLRYKSPLGLFSEEVDPRGGRQIGNFPQALSHIGVVNSALYLGKAQERETPGPELIGSGKKGTEPE